MSKNKRTDRQGVGRGRRSSRGGGNVSNFSGQHLIIDKRLAERLAGFADSGSYALVLDIGAGGGALTVPLAAQGRRILAVENDPVLADKLKQKMKDLHNVQVVERDVLDMKLPGSPFGVVANIPFSITTAILGMLMDRPSLPFQGGALIVELGAAYRFTADPITDPRLLGWRMWFDLDIVQTVQPHSFFPPPGVRSAILRIRRKNDPPVPVRDHSRFMGLAAHGLRYPRKPLGEALQGVFTAPQLKRLLQTLRIGRDAPVCTLDERQWAAVYETMCRYVERHRWPKK